MKLELLQTFVRITSIAPNQCIVHLGHPDKETSLKGGQLVNVCYDGNIEKKFDPQKEMIVIFYDGTDFKIGIGRQQ